MIEISLIIALIFIFNYISEKIFSGFWPQGGNINLNLIFFLFIATRYNLSITLLAIFSYSLLTFFINFYVVNPWQIILDYLIAYIPYAICCLAKSILYKNKKYHFIYWYIVPTIAWSFTFIFAFISGFLFYASYSNDYHNIYIYSFIYNISYMLPSLIINLSILFLIKNQYVYLVNYKNNYQKIININ